MTWLAVAGILERKELVSEMSHLQEMTVLSQYAGELVHELQRERGMSAAFLGSNGNNFRAELPDQRRETDKRLNEFNTYTASLVFTDADAEVQAQVNQANSLLKELTTHRQRVDSQDIVGEQSNGYYTSINNFLISIVSQLTFSVEQGEVIRQLNAYYNLLNIKELAGIERAMLTTAFSTDAMSSDMHSNLLSLTGRSSVYISSFNSFANESIQNELAGVLASDLAQNLLEMRGIAIEQGTAGNFNVDHQQWFEQQTALIDRIAVVGQKAAEVLLETAQNLRDKAVSELTYYLVLSLAAAILAIVLSVLIVRSIARPLQIALKNVQTRGGDLTQRLAVPGSDELSQLYQAFNESTSKTEELVAGIKQGAQSVELASKEIANGNADLAQRTEEQSASLVETASSMEQITATVKQSADTAQEARRSTQDMANQANDANVIAEQARVAMEQIERANEKVTAIVEAIDNIAFQTNLLALNASVEAARAGEQGRGFAVVASEVRNLASRSAEEAKQIRKLIENNVASIKEGGNLVTSTSETLKTIAERAQHTAALVSEISSATNEQSHGIEQINQALTQLEEVIQQNAALVEQVATASRSLDDQAGDMADMVGRFKVSEGDNSMALAHHAY
ncbi:methyl-accepting chemotaxis protein [Vreelandella neptunia]|uniref:Methyl-accepting chemotaxis protein n=1 Tax=Vreelandella neptunia TaxID=115551 RepID=A0ABZ0YQC3_9GAMM|nr:methyl-accepting chemotaxis protein [Halomonas neptunia]MDN3558531.1 methyl-accepting chemotaxis protein [Halomonas neptunia]WQH13502.1 methyl-accepting chemotaxis protein [Halomonas neptunia]